MDYDLSKDDNFETVILRYPEKIRAILRDIDRRVRGFGQVTNPEIAIHRYTTDVPDIRYRVLAGGVPKPVFLRVRPRMTKVRMEIEEVQDPFGKTEPREKSGKWKKSPRADRELIVTEMLDEREEILLRESMSSSMRGPNQLT